jgi:Leucine-rich repeat (LRR) protein
LPAPVYSLAKLNILEIAENKISAIDGEIANLLSLHTIDASANQLAAIHPDIAKLTLKTLKLGKNYLSDLPEAIGKIFTLEVLELHENGNLTSIPFSFSELVSLQSVTLHSNKFESFPWFLYYWRKLVMINLADNIKIDDVPSNISQLTFLKIIEIQDCSITAFPDNIGDLQSLQRLDASNNKISHYGIPAQVGKLQNLTVLKLS